MSKAKRNRKNKKKYNIRLDNAVHRAIPKIANSSKKTSNHCSLFRDALDNNIDMKPYSTYEPECKRCEFFEICQARQAICEDYGPQLHTLLIKAIYSTLQRQRLGVGMAMKIGIYKNKFTYKDNLPLKKLLQRNGYTNYHGYTRKGYQCPLGERTKSDGFDSEIGGKR